MARWQYWLEWEWKIGPVWISLWPHSGFWFRYPSHGPGWSFLWAGEDLLESPAGPFMKPMRKLGPLRLFRLRPFE